MVIVFTNFKHHYFHIKELMKKLNFGIKIIKFKIYFILISQ